MSALYGKIKNKYNSVSVRSNMLKWPNNKNVYT